MHNVPLRAPARMVLILTVLLCLSIPARACHEGTFEFVVDEASDLVKHGSPVSALACYELLYSSSELWQNQSVPLEERFYWEFQDALLQAANVDPNNRSKYLDRATDVSDTYVAWFEGLDPEDKALLQTRGQNRVSNVLFSIGSAFEAMKDREGLLNYFERTAGHPEFFSPRSLAIWERTLRLLPNLDREMPDTEVRAEIGRDVQIAEHWRAYREFLRGLRRVTPMKHLADTSLTKLQPIFSALG